MHKQKKDEELYTLEIAATVLRPLRPGITVDDLRKLVEEESTGMTPGKIFTRDELSKKIKLSLSTIDRLIKAGEIEVVRIRRSVRIPESEVEKILGTAPRNQTSASTLTQNSEGK